MYTNVLEYLEANSNIENSACALSDEKDQVTYGQIKGAGAADRFFYCKTGKLERTADCRIDRPERMEHRSIHGDRL